MVNDDEVKAQRYYIPVNYKEAGGVAGGKLKTRNAIELLVLCGPLAYAEVQLLHFSIQTNLIIGMLTLIPLAALCAFGINGESLSQILFAYIRFRRNRRNLHYQSFTDDSAVVGGKPDLSIDAFLDNIATLGIKGTLVKAKEKRASEKVAPPRRQHVMGTKPTSRKEEETTVVSPSPHKNGDSRQAEAAVEAAQETAHASATVSEKKAEVETRSRGLLNSALKERLLRKLELGDEDDPLS